jgi:hypothetical protein
VRSPNPLTHPSRLYYLRPPAHRAAVRYSGPHPRNSLIFACAGVGIATLVGTLRSPRAGALIIAATLAIAGVWRAAAPFATRAAGIAVRSKTIDVVTYLALAVAIVVLTLSAPGF